MGYDFHITRADDWTRNIEQQISSEEWLTVVQSDPDLQPDPDNGAHAVTWKGHEGLEIAWFDWYQGNVFTTNPDTATLQKMLELARRMEARVVGDDGETYTG